MWRHFLSTVGLVAMVSGTLLGGELSAGPRTPSDVNCFTQNFDLVTAPALPFGWTATNAVGAAPYWVTEATTPDTAPNDAFIDDPPNISDKRLDSPPIPITVYNAQLTFRHAFDFGGSPPIGMDGGVLEVSIAGGAFQDVVAAGGSFVTGGYNGVIGAGNPLVLRSAWIGNSGGYVTTVLQVGGALGFDAVFRWRMGSNESVSAGGWRIDTISLSEPCVLPGFIHVDEHSTTNAPTASPLNGVWEPGEAVVVEPSFSDGETGAVVLTGSSNLIGPSGATYSVLDAVADYGTIFPGFLSDCYYTTNNCYQVYVSNPATRPLAHWDAILFESLSGGLPKFWTLHIGESFTDTPTSNQFYKFIEAIFHNSVTGGCSATSYCPSDSTLRKQMAVFVLKSRLGKNYQPPSCIGTFADVACPGPFTDWIEDLYLRGIVAGCGPGPTYCPENPVLRQQMAVFLLKTLQGSTYVPPPCQGQFPDVPCSNPFAPWIEDLYFRQIAAGCGGGNYCPTNATTRGQMAAFLVKTFGLQLYGP